VDENARPLFIPKWRAIGYKSNRYRRSWSEHTAPPGEGRGALQQENALDYLVIAEAHQRAPVIAKLQLRPDDPAVWGAPYRRNDERRRASSEKPSALAVVAGIGRTPASRISKTLCPNLTRGALPLKTRHGTLPKGTSQCCPSYKVGESSATSDILDDTRFPIVHDSALDHCGRAQPIKVNASGNAPTSLVCARS